MIRHNSQLGAELVRCDCCGSTAPTMLTLSDARTDLSVTVCSSCHEYAYERAGVPMERRDEYDPHRH